MAKVATIKDDLELHVFDTTYGGVTLVDIREYVPSTETFGRGVTFDLSLAPVVLAELQEIVENSDVSTPA